MEIRHYGKVNLSLHVEKKRSDGYHSIDTLMQEVDVSDYLVIKKARETVLKCDKQDVPLDPSNLILRAYEKLRARYGIGPVRFELEKAIPIGAGMGGGSANAAAALRGLNHLFDLGLQKQELARIGLELGADVPYFLTGGTCRAQGVGEILTALPTYEMPLLLINDGTHANTRAVYEQGPEKTPSTMDTLLLELAQGKTRLTVQNDLQKPAFHLYPSLAETFRQIRTTEPDTVQLSGTGATFYAIYPSIKEAEQAYEALRGNIRHVLLTHTRGEESVG